MLKILYETIPGRMLLKALTRRQFSNIIGGYMNSRLSKRKIKSFVRKNNIDMSLCVKSEFNSFNDFFTREQTREFVKDRNVLISPCDSRLSAYKIDADSVFSIKGTSYTVEELICDSALAKEYEGGICLVFRLCVDDYHRYCYIDDGIQGKNIFIPGILHTVNPISFNRYKTFKTNCREYTVLYTENFGKVVQMEVGAMCVGRITNIHENYTFKKGEEKGYFEFGGSTIVLLFKKDSVHLAPTYFDNTEKGCETVVRYGQEIGKKC